MTSFGLGLVLNFVDNASAGMNTATQNFMRMSTTADSITASVGASATEMAAVAFSLSAVGDTFMSIGSSITNVFAGITDQVINTGMQMQGYRMQLSALYGGVEAGEAKIEEIKQYAMNSVFEIQSLIPAVTMMKAVGIEAMQEVTSSSGKSTQKLLDYASDIAAMVPNMRNTYGTGVRAAMGALKEYIAEGNAISLKRGAGLDIEGILGEDKGATVEERTRQIADLTEKLGIFEYTAKLAGTPTQRLSNMQDALFNSLSKIADSGVFKVYCGLLETLSEWVFNLVQDEETFNAITGVLADTITALLSPLEKLLDLVIRNSDAIIGWIKEHPKLTKYILLTVAAIGGLLIAGGALLKFLSSVAFAMAGITMFKALPTMLASIGVAFKGLIAKVFPFVALAAFAYGVWRYNLFGIRDVVTKTMKDLSTVIGLVKDAWEDNTLSIENYKKAEKLGILPLIKALLQLKYYWDFFVEGFKIGFNSFFESLAESLSWLQLMGIDVVALTASVGEFLRSLVEVGAEDKWEQLGKIVGEVTAGLLALAVIVNTLKPIITIISWIGKAGSGVVKVFTTLWGVLKFVFNPLVKAFPKVMIFFSKIGAVISSMKNGFTFFESMGVWFPKITGFLMKFGGALTKIGALFTKFGGWIAAGAKAIGGAIMSALTYIASALGISVGWVVAIIAAIVAVIALVIIFRKEIAQFFVWLWGKITEFCSWFGGVIATFFTNLWSTISSWFGRIFTKVKEVISNIVQAILNNPIVQTIIKLVTSIVNVIVSIVKTIVAIIKGIVTTIGNIIKFIGTIVAGIAKLIWSIVSGVIGTIWTIIKGLVNFIVTCVQGIWNVIKKVINLVWTLIKTAANIIKSIVNVVYQFFRLIFLAILALGKLIITGICNAFTWLWGKIKPILQAIGDFFSFIFNWVYTNIITPVVNGIVTTFNWLSSTISGILQSIGNFFASVFNWINTNVITPFRDFIISVFDWINEKITAVTNWFSEAFTTAANAIQEVFGNIQEFFAGIWESITEGAMAFFDWIGEKLSFLTDTLSKVGEFFSNGIDKAGDWLSGIGDSLASFVGLDTGGYVKTTGLAVLHPNEVVVNDDTTKRLQNFLGKYENNTVNGIVRESTPTQAVMNNIYPTVMESVPVTTVPAEEVSSISNSSVITNNTQNFLQSPKEVIEKSGEVHNDYSVTFATGSIVIQISNATDAELERTAEKLMKIIARKQQLRAMAVRA